MSASSPTLETNRRTANYRPNIWGNTFMVSNSPDDEEILAHKDQQLEDRNEKVRRELIAAASVTSAGQLKFIDAIQRLGGGIPLRICDNICRHNMTKR